MDKVDLLVTRDDIEYGTVTAENAFAATLLARALEDAGYTVTVIERPLADVVVLHTATSKGRKS